MEINALLIVVAVILLLCGIRGAKKGLLGIIFSIIAWVLLFFFINFSQPYIYDYIETRTNIPTYVEDKVEKKVTSKFEKEGITLFDEEAYQGLPNFVVEEVDAATASTRDYIIGVTTKRITLLTLNGIVQVLSLIAGVFVILFLSCLINMVGHLPGIHASNKLLGLLFGLIEGLVVVWILFYIGICFPTTEYGRFIVTNSAQHELLCYIYDSACSVISGI